MVRIIHTTGAKKGTYTDTTTGETFTTPRTIHRLPIRNRADYYPPSNITPDVVATPPPTTTSSDVAAPPSTSTSAVAETPSTSTPAVAATPSTSTPAVVAPHPAPATPAVTAPPSTSTPAVAAPLSTSTLAVAAPLSTSTPAIAAPGPLTTSSAVPATLPATNTTVATTVAAAPATVQHPHAPNAVLNRHGRPAGIYAPTRPQPSVINGSKAKWTLVRGNPPAGIDALKWDLAYNRADSNVGTLKNILRKALRENGMTRDVAIDYMIRDGDLTLGFVDSNP
ncbi:uncharacterized protein RCO7_04065 [Rhynchosporium graminicola]|uniref:Uncharacterized protein n=1 Tax=Rhynchosporium graminicola TaxID=2792576 RepID=A0A1E1LFC0_9HELO|nr:uncharacterized protein RCO7_04065 [Rhynchosporium commune]